MRRVLNVGLIVLLASAVLLALPLVAQAASVHVAVTGNDTTGDGSSGNPYRTVQHAVDVASSGDVVTVGSGTFNGDVTMKNGVSLLGNGSANTELKGSSGLTAVVTANGIGSGTSVSGFTISGGGNGIQCMGSSAVSITDNWYLGIAQTASSAMPPRRPSWATTSPGIRSTASCALPPRRRPSIATTSPGTGSTESNARLRRRRASPATISAAVVAGSTASAPPRPPFRATISTATT